MNGTVRFIPNYSCISLLFILQPQSSRFHLALTCSGNVADLFPTYPLTTWLWMDRTRHSMRTITNRLLKPQTYTTVASNARAGVRAERRKRNLAASDIKGTAHQLTSGVCVTWEDVSLTPVWIFINVGIFKPKEILTMVVCFVRRRRHCKRLIQVLYRKIFNPMEFSV